MTSALDPLEQVFRKVEEESERRASSKPVIGVDTSERCITPPKDIGNSQSEIMKTKKGRRRTSISISRYGQRSDDRLFAPSSPSRLTAIASKSVFYQSQLNSSTVDSLASDGTDKLDEIRTEDEYHFTQVQEIAARRSITKAFGGILSRGLSRTRTDSNVIPNTGVIPDTGVVIGVSTTVESHPDPDAPATVYAAGRIRGQPSSVSVGPPRASSNWVKVFARKLRGKPNRPRALT